MLYPRVGWAEMASVERVSRPPAVSLTDLSRPRGARQVLHHANATLTTPMTTRVIFRTNFRDGDPEHMFEHAGQRNVPDWRGRDGDNVLLERVLNKRKPVGQFVGNPLDLNFVDDEDEVAISSGSNQHGVRILLVTAQPDATLRELLEQRDEAERALVADNWLADAHSREQLQRRTVRRYMVPGGFDMSEDTGMLVNVLESALLYGYPLDAAGAPGVDLTWPE